MKTTIAIPPIEIWDEGNDGRRWCWKTPGGQSGTHEGSFQNAAKVALNAMNLKPADFNLDKLEKGETGNTATT